jgi:hypothetical protein
MTEIETGVHAAAVGQHGADRVADEMQIGDVPAAGTTHHLEQALAGPDIKPLGHRNPPHPPVSACRT